MRLFIVSLQKKMPLSQAAQLSHMIKILVEFDGKNAQRAGARTCLGAKRHNERIDAEIMQHVAGRNFNKIRGRPRKYLLEEGNDDHCLVDLH